MEQSWHCTAQTMVMADSNHQVPRLLRSLRRAAPLAAIAALAIALSLAACAPAPLRQPDVPPLAGQPVYDIPRVDLLRMSPEMEQFVEQYAKSDRAHTGKAWHLAYAALDPYLLDFDYDSGITLPADEAFRSGRGNCLTFSSLFVAMARAAGLEAWYQEVRIPPKWSAVNETLLVSKHVNAVVREHGQEWVIDVSRRKKKDNDETRRMSDSEAEAQYYNNLGADALVEEDLPTAYAYFRAALRAQPGLAYIWSNLGVVYRRNDQAADAILAYETALQYDPNNAVALNNLYTLYTDEGNLDSAAKLEIRVERNRRNNPYYLLYLAEIANEEQRWSDAINLLNRAIKIDANEYRFHFAMAQSQYFAGNSEVAHQSLDRARELAPANLPEGPLTLPDGS
jgi:tetratricopeptide (TPR) repeat protein